MYTLFSTPNIRANRKLPNSPNGMESITANGTNRLSYKAQRIIYTKMIQMAKMTTMDVPDEDSSRVIPPNS